MPSRTLADLNRRVRASGGLPVFPRSLQCLLELLHREGSSMAEIGAAVEQDPVLVTRILRSANSAFYGLSRKVANLRLAIVLLGLRNIRILVMGIGFEQIIQHQDERRPYPGREFCRHSLLCGRAACHLARLHRLCWSGEEYVTGIIHDIGKVILARAYPERAAERGRQLAALNGAELLAAEEEVFGASHPEVGAWAAAEWRLPPSIVVGVRDHHAAPRGAERDALALLVGAADRAARWYLAAAEAPALPSAWRRNPFLDDPRITAQGLRDALATAEWGLEA